MTRRSAIELLQQNLNRLRPFHVRSIWLFGSVARDEARPRDVELLLVGRELPHFQGERRGEPPAFAHRS